MKYLETIQQLNKIIIGCKNLKFIDLTPLPAGEPEKKFVDEHSSVLHPDIAAFYREIKSYNLKWESKIKLPGKIYGQAKLIEVSKAVSDWKEIVYFEDDSPLKHFKILDQFVNEACCGFYTLESKAGSPKLIYYYDFSNTPVSLQLTIEEYINMMVEARGFLYWQKVLTDHLQGVESPHTVLMKQDLNKIFPEFNFDSFIAKYNDLSKSK
jgi:hypothetical protein